MVEREQEGSFHDADFLGIGKHCVECKQLDFLPLECNRCKRHFCNEHFSGHRCPVAGSLQKPEEDKNVIICPICARGVERKPHVDPNVLIDEHCRSKECDPDNYSRVHERKKCPGAGCRVKLTTVNSYECRHCGVSTCVKHRFPGDHTCVPMVQGKSPLKNHVDSMVTSLKRFFSIS